MVPLPPPPDPRPPAASLGRRTLVVGALGGVASLGLAGCTGDDGQPAAAPAPRSGGVTPDVAVATTALAQIRAVREAAAATQARFPATRSTLGEIVRLHRTHEASLVDAVPEQAGSSTGPAAYAVPRQREKALRVLAAREQQLHDSLDALALQAQSGQFARLLASMGSALTQRLAQWPR